MDPTGRKPKRSHPEDEPTGQSPKRHRDGKAARNTRPSGAVTASEPAMHLAAHHAGPGPGLFAPTFLATASALTDRATTLPILDSTEDLLAFLGFPDADPTPAAPAAPTAPAVPTAPAGTGHPLLDQALIGLGYPTTGPAVQRLLRFIAFEQSLPPDVDAGQPDVQRELQACYARPALHDADVAQTVHDDLAHLRAWCRARGGPPGLLLDHARHLLCRSLSLPQCRLFLATLLADGDAIMTIDDPIGARFATDILASLAPLQPPDRHRALLANPRLRQAHACLDRDIRALFSHDLPVTSRLAVFEQRLDLAALFKVAPHYARENLVLLGDLADPAIPGDEDRLRHTTRAILRPLLDPASTGGTGGTVALALQYEWMVQHTQPVITQSTRDILIDLVRTSSWDLRSRFELLRAIHRPHGPVSYDWRHSSMALARDILERIAVAPDAPALRREFIAEIGEQSRHHGHNLGKCYFETFGRHPDFLFGLCPAPRADITSKVRQRTSEMYFSRYVLADCLRAGHWHAPEVEWERNMSMLVLGMLMHAHLQAVDDPLVPSDLAPTRALDPASLLQQGILRVAWARQHLLLGAADVEESELTRAARIATLQARIAAHEQAPLPRDPALRRQERALRTLALATHILGSLAQPTALLPALPSLDAQPPCSPDELDARRALHAGMAADRVTAWRIACEYDGTVLQRSLPEDPAEAELVLRGRAAHASLWDCRGHLRSLRELTGPALAARLRLWLEGSGPIRMPADEFATNLTLLLELLDRADARLAPTTRHEFLRRYLFRGGEHCTPATFNQARDAVLRWQAMSDGGDGADVADVADEADMADMVGITEAAKIEKPAGERVALPQPVAPAASTVAAGAPTADERRTAQGLQTLLATVHALRGQPQEVLDLFVAVGEATRAQAQALFTPEFFAEQLAFFANTAALPGGAPDRAPVSMNDATRTEVRKLLKVFAQTLRTPQRAGVQRGTA